MTHFLLLFSLKVCPRISSINVSSELGHGLPGELQTASRALFIETIEDAG